MDNKVCSLRDLNVGDCFKFLHEENKKIYRVLKMSEDSYVYFPDLPTTNYSCVVDIYTHELKFLPSVFEVVRYENSINLQDFKIDEEIIPDGFGGWKNKSQSKDGITYSTSVGEDNSTEYEDFI